MARTPAKAPAKAPVDKRKFRLKSAADTAKLLGARRNTVQGWIDAGCPTVKRPVGSGDSYVLDLREVVEWRIATEAEKARKAARRPSGDSNDEDVAGDILKDPEKRMKVARLAVQLLSVEAMEDRAEAYPAEVPDGVRVVTWGNDNQEGTRASPEDGGKPSRMELVFWGWGYLALRLLKGGDSAEADVNAGCALLLSKGGKNASDGAASANNFKGAWSQTQTYVHGDMVQVVVSRTNSALWRAFADGIPPGVAPGADPRWGRISIEATNDLRFHHAGPMLDGAILGGGGVTRPTSLLASLASSRVYASGVRAVNVQVYVNGTLVSTSSNVGSGNPVQTATWSGPSADRYLNPGDVVTAKLQFVVKDSVGVTTGSASDAVVVALCLV